MLAGTWSAISTVLLIIMFTVVNISNCGAPPKLRPNYKNSFRSAVGGNVKIPCPVDFDTADKVTFFNWGKDGASLDSAPNAGLEFEFAEDKRILRIYGVTVRHQGTYYCEGTNGYGMAKGVFKLVIYDPSDENPLCGEQNISNGLHYSAPCFPNGHADKVIRATVDSLVKLNCSAAGHPEPSFKWLKAGKSIDWIVSAQGKTTSQLQLHNVQKGHEGAYTCTASNSFGSVTARYSLIVIDKYEPAHILDPRPMNITVRVGESANFVCRIRAKGTPTVRWGKRISKELKQYYEQIKKETLVFLNEIFVVLDPHQVEPQHENDPNKLGTYSIELKIPSASSSSAGKYVCMVIGPKGEIDQKAAYLYVTSELPGNNNYIILFISVPLAIIICVFIMIFCIISRKRAYRNGQRRNGTVQRYALKGQITTPPTVTQFGHYPSFSTQDGRSLGYIPVHDEVNHQQQKSIQQLHFQQAQTQLQHQQLLHDGTPSSSAASSWVGSRSQYTHQPSIPHMNSQAGSFNSVPSNHNGHVLENSYPT